jgi:hypothetical protein
MFGDIGLFLIDGRKNFANATLSVPKQFKDLQPGGLAEGLKNIGLSFQYLWV